MRTARNVIVTAMLVWMLSASVSSASAAATNTHDMVNESVSWAIPVDVCPLIPTNIGLSGTGQRHKVINTRTNADGSQTIVTNDTVKGSAVDSNGGTYHFVYSNHSTVRMPASGFPIHTDMVDNFVLNGSGSINNFAVGFNWSWDFTGGDPSNNFPFPFDPLPPGVTNVQRHSTRGTILCDPL